MRKNYIVVEHPIGQDTEYSPPPPAFDSYAEALNHVVLINSSYHKSGLIVTPILNGQFAWYATDGDVPDNGWIVRIDTYEDEDWENAD